MSKSGLERPMYKYKQMEKQPIIDISHSVKEHNQLLNINIHEDEMSKTPLVNYDAIFVGDNKTINEWQSDYNHADERLNIFITNTINKYNQKLKIFNWKHLPFRYQKLTEMYEQTPCDITKRLDNYTKGVIKYLPTMKEISPESGRYYEFKGKS